MGSLGSQTPFHLVAQKSPAFIPPTVSQQGFALLQLPLLIKTKVRNTLFQTTLIPQNLLVSPKLHTLCHSLLSLPAAMGGFQCGLQSCFQLCCPSSHQMDPENFPSKKPIPCRCLESLLQRKRCSGLVEGEMWSLCLAGSRTGNWER